MNTGIPSLRNYDRPDKRAASTRPDKKRSEEDKARNDVMLQKHTIIQVPRRGVEKLRKRAIAKTRGVVKRPTKLEVILQECVITRDGRSPHTIFLGNSSEM